MPTAKSAITSRVTVKNPRPRKYASAAEKQAAFRARFPTLCVRVEPKTADTVQAVADASGRTQQETLLSMLKYAMTNRNWITLGLTEHKQLPRIEEPRKANPMKTEILERAKLPNGTLVRLQKRGKAYDVITNSTGITWRYLEKAVSEERARNAFDLYTMQHKQNPMKTIQAKRKPTPAQIAARERFAAMARSGAFKKKAAKARKKNPSRSGIGFEGYDPYASIDRLDEYRQKSDAELRYIIQDAGEAAKAQRGMSSEGKYLDQVNDATTVLYERRLAREKAIAASNRSGRKIGKREASAINRLLTGRSGNPAKKTVSQKISQLTREGYPQKQAVAIALSEERAGKVKRNPRASNPVKPKKQRMLNISWMTAGGQREIMSVPIDFVFTHYVGNVAERFFVRTDNGQLIVSEYSTGGRIGQVPYTMRAAALNDRDAAKRYVGEMLSRIGAERFKAAVKKFDPIN